MTAEPSAEPAPEPERAAAPKRPAAKGRKRASVPSWDEIVFGIEARGLTAAIGRRP